MRSINITSLNNTELLYVPTVLDYFELMKPRVMSLVVFTAFVGYYNAAPVLGNSINPYLALIGIFAIALEQVRLVFLINGMTKTLMF